MRSIHSFKDHICSFKMTPKAWFYLTFWQSYEWLRVDTWETVNSRKTYQKFISVG